MAGPGARVPHRATRDPSSSRECAATTGESLPLARVQRSVAGQRVVADAGAGDSHRRLGALDGIGEAFVPGQRRLCSPPAKGWIIPRMAHCVEALELRVVRGGTEVLR